MITFNQKNIGYFVIGFSLILLVILGFIKAETDRQGVFLCEAVAADPTRDMSECPFHKSSMSWMIILAFGLAFVILASGIYLVYAPVEKGFKKIDVSKLDKGEKSVYDFLKKGEGSAYQSDIIKETGFSKVKTTRILDKLESRKIIDRKRRGMTNIIILR